MSCIAEYFEISNGYALAYSMIVLDLIHTLCIIIVYQLTKLMESDLEHITLYY